MPVLNVGDESIGQSSAINFYLAAENGLLGSSNLEAAKIIGIEESIKEMQTAFRTLVPYGTIPTDEALDQWFTGGATDVSGPAQREGQQQRYAVWYLGRIEQLLGDNGFAVP